MLLFSLGEITGQTIKLFLIGSTYCYLHFHKLTIQINSFDDINKSMHFHMLPDVTIQVNSFDDNNKITHSYQTNWAYPHTTGLNIKKPD